MISALAAACVLAAALLGTTVAQPPDDRRGGQGGQEAIIEGEVKSLGAGTVVVSTGEGVMKDISVTSRTGFVREAAIGREALSMGDRLLMIGGGAGDDALRPFMVRVLSGGARGPDDRGSRGRGPQGADDAQRPLVGTVVGLDPLTVELSSGTRRAVEITDATRLFKETALEASDVQPGARVRVVAPPRPGASGREAMKVIIISDAAPPLSQGAVPSAASPAGGLLDDLPQQGPAPAFIYGVWLGRGLFSNEELDRAFKVARNLGVRYMKVEFKWDYVEPVNDGFRWDNEATLDVEHLMGLARRYGISVIPYFETFMPWDEVKRVSPERGECEGPPSRRGQYQAPDAQEYAEYVFAVVDRLKRGGVDVGYIELDNEVSNINDGYVSRNCFINMTAKEIKTIENAAYDMVKAVYPDVRVSSTSFSFPGIGPGIGRAVAPGAPGLDIKRKNSFIKAYFGEEPRPRFDFLALHEVLSGTGNPYTTAEASPDGYNFASYNEAYGLWRDVLDRYGYGDRAIINTESGAVLKGMQDSQLLQRAIFARTNEQKNGVRGWILSQLTPSRRFSEGGEEGISVGITRLASSYETREGYRGFYALQSVLARHPVYEGRVSGALNGKEPVVERFGDGAGNTLYAAFIPYRAHRGAPGRATVDIGPGMAARVLRADATASVVHAGSDGRASLDVDDRPAFIEVLR
jgi:hypothetical protein